MKRIELITSKEYWVDTLEELQQLGHTDYDIATVIANKMVEAMNYIPCCMGEAEQLPKNYCTSNRHTCGKGSVCKYPHCHI